MGTHSDIPAIPLATNRLRPIGGVIIPMSIFTVIIMPKTKWYLFVTEP